MHIAFALQEKVRGDLCSQLRVKHIPSSLAICVDLIILAVRVSLGVVGAQQLDNVVNQAVLSLLGRDWLLPNSAFMVNGEVGVFNWFVLPMGLRK
jgi:hypothetical protein